MVHSIISCSKTNNHYTSWLVSLKAILYILSHVENLIRAGFTRTKSSLFRNLKLFYDRAQSQRACRDGIDSCFVRMSSRPAALSFLRQVIVFWSSFREKVHVEFSLDWIHGGFSFCWILCWLLPFSRSWRATWFAVTLVCTIAYFGRLLIYSMVDQAFLLSWHISPPSMRSCQDFLRSSEMAV